MFCHGGLFEGHSIGGTKQDPPLDSLELFAASQTKGNQHDTLYLPLHVSLPRMHSL